MTDHRTVEHAERRLQQFERRLLSDALLVGQPDAPALVRHAVDLVAHAALPVVCDAELLHLLRINFFVDAEALPYWVEGRTLLSPLWQDLGDGLYTMEPVLRRLLLQRLIANRGARRTAEVATLLWQAAERRSGWAEKTELRHAQQLTALNFLAPERAREWLAQARTAGGGEALDNAWFVAMGDNLELPKPGEQSGDAQAMCELLLSLVPVADTPLLVKAAFPGISLLHGEPGTALQWQLIRRLVRRSPLPRLLWLELDPATGGDRLFTRLPGRRDRAAIAPRDTSWDASAIKSADRVIAIDHAEGFKHDALAAWLRRFGGSEVILLAHRRLDAARLRLLVTLPWVSAASHPGAVSSDPWPTFSRDSLTLWFDSVDDRLPPALRAEKISDRLLYIDALLKATDGMPERVFERLCADAGVRWPDVQAVARARLEPPASVSAREALLALAREYDATRGHRRAGAERTAEMEGIVARMQPLLADIPESAALAWGEDESAGVRLLMVRWLHDHPLTLDGLWLAQRVLGEKPFISYHALLAFQQAARVLPLAELDNLDVALKRVNSKLASLKTDADRLHAYEEVYRILDSRREASLLLAVGDVPLISGTELTWTAAASRMREARAAGRVHCGVVRKGAVGTVADVFGGNAKELHLVGRERVRVTDFRADEGRVPMEVVVGQARPDLNKAFRSGLARVRIELYPDEPAPITSEAGWALVRSALKALEKLALKLDAMSPTLARDDFAALYECLYLAVPLKRLQAVYAQQGRTRKLDLAFSALTSEIVRRLPRRIDAGRTRDLLGVIGRLFKTAVERQRVSTGRIDDKTPSRERPPWPPLKLSPAILASALALRPGDVQLWAALQSSQADTKPKASPLRLWPNGSVLRLRFIGGDQFRRERVLSVAKAWFEHANLTLDVLPMRAKAAGELRVAFGEPDVSWSYLGTDAKNVPADQPTMNLGWVGPAVDDKTARGAILKEFGHALGLIQEHMSPNRNFEWDEASVLKDMGGPPNFWDRQTVQNNLLNKLDPFDYRPFDPDSVMLHLIPAHWVKSGTPMGGATKLSASDKELIARLYPNPKPAVASSKRA